MEEAKELPDEALVIDLKTSLDYTQEYFQSTLVESKEIIDDNKIAFEYLWLLIPSNTCVYHCAELTEQDQILSPLGRRSPGACCCPREEICQAHEAILS